MCLESDNGSGTFGNWSRDDTMMLNALDWKFVNSVDVLDALKKIHHCSGEVIEHPDDGCCTISFCKPIVSSQNGKWKQKPAV